MSNVIVEKSVIEGTGVFATRDILAGESILVIDDSHVVMDRNTLTDYQNTYEADWVSDNKAILMQPPERNINHSCDPNAYIKTIDGVRNLLAMRNIRKGEEVTMDYGINGFYDTDMICRCGSANCRKTNVTNFFKFPRELQLRYLPYLDEWFLSQFSDEIKKMQK